MEKAPRTEVTKIPALHGTQGVDAFTDGGKAEAIADAIESKARINNRPNDVHR